MDVLILLFCAIFIVVIFSTVRSIASDVKRLRLELEQFLRVHSVQSTEHAPVPESAPIQEPEPIVESAPIQEPEPILESVPILEPSIVEQPSHEITSEAISEIQPAAASESVPAASVPTHTDQEIEAQLIYDRTSRDWRGVPTRSRADFESIVGANLLNRIGAAAMLIGMVFLFIWGSDNGYITEPLRVICGLIVGLGALALGPRLERKNLQVFAQGVMATGAAILYMSVYAAFAYYHLIPPLVAYAGMVGVTTIVLWRSLKHNSLFLASLSGIAGFATPLALQTGDMNTAGLFAYITLIDLMLIGTVIGLRKWMSLYYLAIAFTALWWGIWIVSGYGWRASEQPASTIAALLDGMVFLASIVVLKRRTSLLTEQLLETPALIGVGVMLAMVDFTTHDMASWLKVCVLSFQVLTVIAAIYALRRTVDATFLRRTLAVMAVILARLLPWLSSLDTDTQLVAQLCVAIASSYVGRRFDYQGMRFTANLSVLVDLGILLFASASYVLGDEALPFLNVVTLRWILLCFYGWFLVEKYQPVRQFAPMFLTFAFSYQAWHLFHRMLGDHWALQLLSVTTWTLLCGVVVVLGRRRSLFFTDIYGLGGLVIGVLMWISISVTVPPVALYSGILNVRVATGLLISLMLVLMWYALPRLRWNYHDGNVIWPVVLVVSFMMCSEEVIWPFLHWIDAARGNADMAYDDMVDLWNGLHLALSCAWIAYAAVIVAIGFVKRIKVARLAGIGVLGVAVLKVFLYDLSNLQTPFRIISFIVLGLILFGASFLYARFKDRIIA
ncbi:hypothetical protein BH10BAC6_BH10BAC6_18670 [soil metagenome]